MSMTENKAIDVLDELNCLHIDVVRANAIEVAIQALEEIQQYREIGTVEDFKALKEKEERFDRNIKMFNEIGLEIRNMAIDEFAEKLKELCGVEIGVYQYTDLLHESRIDEIAEELKEVLNE